MSEKNTVKPIITVILLITLIGLLIYYLSIPTEVPVNDDFENTADNFSVLDDAQIELKTNQANLELNLTDAGTYRLVTDVRNLVGFDLEFESGDLVNEFVPDPAFEAELVNSVDSGKVMLSYGVLGRSGAIDYNYDNDGNLILGHFVINRMTQGKIVLNQENSRAVTDEEEFGFSALVQEI